MANFLIAPDFPPEHFAGWHLLNTYFQRRTGANIHLLTPASATEEYAMIDQDIVDIIYANPFDAARLVYDKGYLPVVKPVGKSDEVVIAARKGRGIEKLSGIKKGSKIAMTNNYDVKLISLRLLEPIDLTENDFEWVEAHSFQASARMLLRGEVDVAFFVASAYHALSSLTQRELNVLVESHLADIIHVILLHPRRATQITGLQNALINMKNNPAGQLILDELDIPHGFKALTQEETEFMIDLMETLKD